MIRTEVVKSLFQNLVGPKKGIDETIVDPYSKYQVGILTSCFHLGHLPSVTTEPSEVGSIVSKISPSPESNEPSGHEDLPWPDTELSLEGSFTLGVSFVVSGDSPEIKICCTWGRYEYSNSILPKSLRVFKRSPNYFLTDWEKVDEFGEVKKILLVNGGGNVVTLGGAELHMRAIKSKKGRIVQIFLVNRTEYINKTKKGKPKRQDTVHRIFQPQIRINLKDCIKNKIVDLGENNTEEVLHLNRGTKARGFQCGAIWKEIDPEGTPGGFSEFSWPDKDINTIPEQIKTEFTCPDIRTEYLPTYTILQPKQSGNTYDAERLADEWDTGKIKGILIPLIDRYKEWISEQEKKILTLPPNLQDKAKKHIDGCHVSLDEINKGINFICTDERARLSFCFMNSVMSQKFQIENKKKLEWFEFQMAFILQTLRSVSGNDKKGHELADVLWFPTGGGKTEAYLGISVFAMAYRRLLEKSDCVDSEKLQFENDGGVNIISRYTLRLLTMQQFQRAIGAIIIADMKRIENWIPKGTTTVNLSESIKKRFSNGSLWGKSRFSIGLWIGTASTPSRFAYYPGGNRGKHILNAEGQLIPRFIEGNGRSIAERVLEYSEEPEGEPAIIKKCPICANALCFPDKGGGFINSFTWVVKTRKTIQDLRSIDKQSFVHTLSDIDIDNKPQFELISTNPNGENYVRVTMKISLKRNTDNLHQAIDKWWLDFVEPNFSKDSLQSTSASFPGYFFIYRDGETRPYDFVIHCTNSECELNSGKKWFGSTCDENTIPKAFQVSNTDKRSISIPISAYTIDEQVYSRCPTLVISTVDKFANLPWEPRCASLFGNIDCYHEHFGYGRKKTPFESPLLIPGKNERYKPPECDLKEISPFLPPSLIIQDEVHLIEGPLGSMVGVYEMALDGLCQFIQSKPKYICFSATIKEVDSLINTIYRRRARIFPSPGIEISDNFFADTHEDPSCVAESSGRLYMGICSAKSVFELPIKLCSITMSTVFDIKNQLISNGSKVSEVFAKIDPYWTCVSYFSDLRLQSIFARFYDDDIQRDIEKFSPNRIGDEDTIGVKNFPAGARIFPIKIDNDIDVHSITILSYNSHGNISVAIYNHEGKKLFNSKLEKILDGQNVFESRITPVSFKRGDDVYIGVFTDADSIFCVVKNQKQWSEITNVSNGVFPDPINLLNPKAQKNEPPMQIQLLGDWRRIKEPVLLSSETSSKELPTELDKISTSLVDNHEKTVDAVLTSPIFGTGIDVNRLGLMNVMTQPKSTSGYIQATGRVGRSKPALVLVWFSPRRPRDLDHYENFVGYHRKINSHVEPITANPFSEESLDLCLGPVIVSLLRNGRKINGEEIPNHWIPNFGKKSNFEGPYRMLKNITGGLNEVNSLKIFLECLGGNPLIPKFRRFENFSYKINVMINKWKKIIQDKDDVIYGERNPVRPGNNNTILGSPFQNSRGFKFAFKNTRNSLRNTESTAVFFNRNDSLSIRPSQFMTRYGSGAFLPGTNSVIALPVSNMVSQLEKPIGNFDEIVDGKRGLKKIEIDDFKMRKMLRSYNNNSEIDQIHIFEMPTNESLNSETNQINNLLGIYETKQFPTWAYCQEHKTLSKIIDGVKPTVKCPKCMDDYNDMKSTKIVPTKFVMACTEGHLYDPDWNKLIHTNNKCSHTSCQDENRVFMWDESNGDDVSFRCYGYWHGPNLDQWNPTTCGCVTKYSEVKHQADTGKLDCLGFFVEVLGNNSCEAKAKFVKKSTMSLRQPIVLSTVNVTHENSDLFERLYNYNVGYMMTMISVKGGNSNWNEKDLAKKLRETQEIHKMPNKLIDEIENMDRNKLTSLYDEFVNEKKSGEVLTEKQEVADELSNLRNGMLNGARQVTPGGVQTKYPIIFDSKYGFSFKAMPFSNLRVTTVQTGYTREMTDYVPNNQGAPQSMLHIRSGKPVTEFSKHKESHSNYVWYMGNQGYGEGIFIQFDENKKKISSISDLSVKKHANNWNEFHKKIIAEGKQKLSSVKSAVERDNIEKAIMGSNPLFVWWHTLAHQIISELSIDSGFAATAIRERVYCIEDGNGGYSTGIIVYVSAQGSDGTLGGLTSMVDDSILPLIVDKAIERLQSCSNDPICAEREFNGQRHRGAGCHACIIGSETSCSYIHKFLDRNLVSETTNV